jgi:hypothetical protein
MTSTLTRTSSTPPVVRRADRRLHLPKRGRRALLVAHVLSSVGWFGVAAMVLLLLTQDQYEAVEISLWLSVPLAAVSGVTGIVLGLGTPWGVATHWWIVLKELAFVPLVLTDLLVVRPAVHDAARGITGGRILDAAIAHCVVLALATVISIVKPFGKTPRGRRRLPSRG